MVEYINWDSKGVHGLIVKNLVHWGYAGHKDDAGVPDFSKNDVIGIMLRTGSVTLTDKRDCKRFIDDAVKKIKLNNGSLKGCDRILFHIEGSGGSSNSWEGAFAAIDAILDEASIGKKSIYIYMGCGSLDAAQELITSHPDYRYVIGCYGGASANTIKHAAKLVDRFRKHGIEMYPCISEATTKSDVEPYKPLLMAFSGCKRICVYDLVLHSAVKEFVEECTGNENHHVHMHTLRARL